MPKNGQKQSSEKASGVLAENVGRIGVIYRLGSIVKRLLRMREWNDICTFASKRGYEMFTLDIESEVSKDLLELQKELIRILGNNDLIRLNNVVEESISILGKVESTSTSFKDKSELISNSIYLWLELWNHYKDIPSTDDLLYFIKSFIDKLSACTRLYLGIHYVNEDRTNNYVEDLKRITFGFHQISETVDIYFESLSAFEINQLCSGAKKVFELTNPHRSIEEYLSDGEEISSLNTQLRAYSSLILWKVDSNFKSQSNHSDEFAEAKAFSRLQDLNDPNQWVIAVDREEEIDLEELDKKIRESGYLV